MIYVVAHKQFTPPELDHNYLPIYVGEKGRAYAKENNLLTDDSSSSENISEKNASYCELTALFWVWKNDIQNDFIGLNHYRRFFLSKCNPDRILDTNETCLSLRTNDMILPQKLKFHCSIKKYYCMTTGYEKDLQILGNIISSRYPDYVKTYNTFLSGHEMVYANMFVTSRKILREYCAWLFDILFHTEKEVDTTNYTPPEKRVYGYMGELLLNVWIIHHKLKIDYYPLMNTERTSDLKLYITNSMKRIAKEIIYFPSGIPYRRRLKKKGIICKKD